MSTRNSRFYLNKREGKLLGVCAGLADYLSVEAVWVRIAVVALTLLGSFVTVPLYLIIAFFASRRPDELYDYRYADEDHYRQTSRQDRSRSTRMRSDLSEMDRRLADVESHYGNNSRLASEIDRLR